MKRSNAYSWPSVTKPFSRNPKADMGVGASGDFRLFVKADIPVPTLLGRWLRGRAVRRGKDSGLTRK